jgi:serine protease Do
MDIIGRRLATPRTTLTVSARLQLCACLVSCHSSRTAEIGNVVELASAAVPAVVRIHTTGAMAQGTGAGFFIRGDDRTDFIVTTNHVVWGADAVTVQAEGDVARPAEVVGADPEVDLAVLRLRHQRTRDAPALRFGDDRGLAVGDVLVAIGTPDGVFNAVSVGILSARAKVARGPVAGESFVKYLFTDAAVSVGSSGGPVLDLDGAVVGISAAILAGGTALGIAIPAHLASPIIKTLQRGEPFRHSFSGIRVADVPDAPAPGPRVVAAASESVRAGDRVIAINGSNVRTAGEFEWREFMESPGTKWVVQVQRGGQRVSTSVILQPLMQERFVHPHMLEVAQ